MKLIILLNLKRKSKDKILKNIRKYYKYMEKVINLKNNQKTNKNLKNGDEEKVMNLRNNNCLNK